MASSGRLKLCFGIRIDAGEWGDALGVKLGDRKAQDCTFCLAANPTSSNFCGNCGTDLRQTASDMKPSDIVDVTLTTMGAPPHPLQLIPGKTKSIYLCQVLSSSDHGFAALQRPLERFPWPAIEKAIKSYAELPETEETRPYMFALDWDREEK